MYIEKDGLKAYVNHRGDGYGYGYVDHKGDGSWFGDYAGGNTRFARYIKDFKPFKYRI